MKFVAASGLLTCLCVTVLAPGQTDAGKLKKFLGPLALLGGAAGAGAIGGAWLESHKHH
ncbi:hypothetical protein BIW11_13845, partial [Tropilaelaps mercedesae]